MFGKKKKIQANSDELIVNLNESNESKKDTDILDRGMVRLKDLLAPSSFDRSNPDYMIVGRQYIRNFIMEGFPNQCFVGWLDNLYSYDGDLDTIMHIEPTDDREALDSLTAKITQYQSQLEIEMQKGSVKDVTRLRDAIQGFYEERSKLERNTDKLYQIQIAVNLYSNSLENLNKETQRLDNKLRGRKIYLEPTTLRQDEGYKTVLPLGKTYIEDKFRNFNSGALTACFPFYNNDILHENGVFCGVNIATWTPVLIDFYDRNIFNNGNITVIGRAGTGKTFFVSLLTMRSALRNIRTVIIDPEGEYKKLTEALGGAYIYIAPDSTDFINAFDIEAEDILDNDFIPTGEKIVKIKEKASDLVNLIAVMSGGLNPEQRAIISSLLQELYSDLGITEDPKSLIIDEPRFDSETGIFYHDGMQKVMPTFSDFYKKLLAYCDKHKENKDLKSLCNALHMFKKGSLYDLFDCRTSDSLVNFTNAPIVTFDISKLEENILRPIGMYVALTWTWEKFIKRNQRVLKRIVCDEAWMLVNKNMPGFEFTAQFLENTARRIRKRNGGLLVASQNFIEFASSDQGKAVLNNAVVNIFLGQDSTDIKLLQETFNLSDGEAMFLLSAKRGEMLIKMASESAIASVLPFEYEKKLIEKKKISD